MKCRTVWLFTAEEQDWTEARIDFRVRQTWIQVLGLFNHLLATCLAGNLTQEFASREQTAAAPQNAVGCKFFDDNKTFKAIYCNYSFYNS